MRPSIQSTPAAFGLLLALACPTAFAGDEVPADAPNLSSPDKAGTSDGADPLSGPTMMSIADTLVQWGRQNGSPEALLTAARILQATPHEATEAKRDDAASTERGTSKSSSGPDTTPEALLQEAVRLEGSLARYVRSRPTLPGSKGHIHGAQSGVDIIQAHGIDWWDLGTFRGGEFAHVEVRGDGDTDLDCWLYDQNDNLIARDVDTTDWCILTFRPRWTGNFRLKIKNFGSVPNVYRIAHN